MLPVLAGKILAKRLMPVSPDEEIIPWIQSKKRVDKDFLEFLDEARDPHAGIFDAAKRIQVPTLLMYGDREAGAIVSHKVVQELEQMIPGLQAAHIEGANHDIRRSKFEKYMQVLKTFLHETAWLAGC
jgi:pimeloyl-ACP methyl ester carboxylesterase